MDNSKCLYLHATGVTKCQQLTFAKMSISPPVVHTGTQVAVAAFTTSTAPLVFGHRQAGQSLQLDTSLQQVVDDFHVLDIMPFEAALHLGILILPPVLHLQYAHIQRCVSPAQ